MVEGVKVLSSINLKSGRKFSSIFPEETSIVNSKVNRDLQTTWDFMIKIPLSPSEFLE